MGKNSKSFAIINSKSDTLTGEQSDLCAAWLGPDWKDSMSNRSALALADACESKKLAGDKRDYNEIRDETMREMGI